MLQLSARTPPYLKTLSGPEETIKKGVHFLAVLSVIAGVVWIGSKWPSKRKALSGASRRGKRR